MNRGQAQHEADRTTRVMVWPDGGTSLTNQPVIEAIAAIAEAESHARIDQLRRDFDAAVEEHCARFGFGVDGERIA